MGIAGIFKEIGPGQRIALVKVASDHFVAHQRPLRLAIDISIWLFQIQSGKGGSNPALRTFYYRLLRLLSLNIHPLFVFDGPNKPLFKRNKRVGGPGVKVASVPEFLAKQLLKQFGFPLHIAPGEAEAECALLQREGIVDAVLSEDVDTLMFGSGVTLRNWTPENSSKTPTHVNLYRAEKTLETSGLDREGMILVALMSGGDYIVEGIAGCGPKVACDAARAGFGRELCAVAKRRDAAALKQWRERLQHEIQTNESKYFSRKNTRLSIPDDFPNRGVLGYYTDPCVSSPTALVRLRDTLRWDQDIDFVALRNFVAEAFDWTCLGGAKKFIRNLAPAMLVRRLRFLSDPAESLGEEPQKQKEETIVHAILGKRNHSTTDGELEYRICFTPADLVTIDLSIEDPDDDYVPAGGAEDQVDVEDEWMTMPSGSQSAVEPASPTKKRNFRPYDPSQPEKLWMIRPFLLAGCPLTVEQYEAPPTDAHEVLRARRKAKACTSRRPAKTKKKDIPQNTLISFATVTKAKVVDSSSAKRPIREPLRARGVNTSKVGDTSTTVENLEAPAATFKLPSVQPTLSKFEDPTWISENEKTPRVVRERSPAPAQSLHMVGHRQGVPRTPRHRKRRSPDPPSSSRTQRTIESYWSTTPVVSPSRQPDIVDLLSSPVQGVLSRAATPSPCTHATQSKYAYTMDPEPDYFDLAEIPDTVTKRRKRAPLRRSLSAPNQGDDGWEAIAVQSAKRPTIIEVIDPGINDALDLASPMTVASLPSPSTFLHRSSLHIPGKTDIALLNINNLHKDEPSMEISNIEVLDLSGMRGELTHSTYKAPKYGLSHLQRTKNSVRLRESLPGSWEEISGREGDQSSRSITRQMETAHRATQSSSLLPSNIEILDLTGE